MFTTMISSGAYPDMIITVPLNMSATIFVLLFMFGPEGARYSIRLGMGLFDPRIGMILFRGTWAPAPA